MTMSGLLLIVILCWTAVNCVGMYWAHHTKMFDDDEAEQQPEK